MCAWERVCVEMYSMHPMIQNSLEITSSPIFLPSTSVPCHAWVGLKKKKKRILKEEFKSPYKANVEGQKIGLWSLRRQALQMKCPGINCPPPRLPGWVGSADWAEMSHLRKVSSVPSLSSPSSRERAGACPDNLGRFCSANPNLLNWDVGILHFSFWIQTLDHLYIMLLWKSSDFHLAYCLSYSKGRHYSTEVHESDLFLVVHKNQEPYMYYCTDSVEMRCAMPYTTLCP